ncbi:3-oxoacyl-[acyl-carrier-protein] reductase, partial [Geitlerinema sp. P-1104]|nr:3-oxoacyl-[acyl-carrier-protein] reductase [Geitlerinema sp. P-1104]
MKGQTVLLTGGTGGLGMGVTPKLVAQGASLTIPYRNTAEVDRLK